MGLEDELKAEEVYELAKEKGLLSAALVNVYLQHWAVHKNAEKFEENFTRLDLDGVEPDESTYILKLKALFHMSDITRFMETWEEMQLKKPELITSASYNLVALSLAHGKDTDRLQVLLTNIFNKYQVQPGATYEDVGIYEAILLNYGFLGDYTKLVETFNEMLKTDKVRINNAHCVAAMMGMCAASRATLAEKFVYQYVRKELIRFKKALNLNLRMLYRILLAECIEARDADVATRTYESIVSTGIVAGDLLPFETNCMVRLHLDRGEEDMANKYFENFLKSVPISNRQPLPLDLVRIYVNHYIETNEPAKTLRFWQKYGNLVETPQINSPGAKAVILDKSRLALEVYAIAGETKSARALFDKMIADGASPTPEVCQLVMKAYINANDSKRAITLFEETQSNGVTPTTASYNLIARIYASRGDLAKTMTTIEAMEADGCEPNGQTWAHVMQAHAHSKKWPDVIQTFESHFLLDGSTTQASEVAAEGEAAPAKLFKATLAEFTTAFNAAAATHDKARVALYWATMKAQEGVMSIDHFFAVLSAAGPQLPLFISILQHLKKRIQKVSFHLSFDQSKQLAKIIRQVLVSQHSPLWQDLELLSNTPGRGQLSWDKKKDWATLLQKVIYEWTAQNP